uniref:HEAT repeat-containing protein 1 n=1 Tax=Echinostoma caproni TaxID=27848 RepID=A0A183BD41_9TREM
LMLSILESSLDEERNELVAAAAIRSLASLVTLMTDCDKLSQIIQRLTQFLLRGHPLDQHTVIPELVQVRHTNQLTRSAEKRIDTVRPTFTTTVDWFLPAVAQWCLELDSLHTSLIDPWLDHVDNYLLNSRKPETDTPHEMTTRCLGILEHLVPFLHAWLMVTMVEPRGDNSAEKTLWLTAQHWSEKQRNSESVEDTSSFDERVPG